MDTIYFVIAVATSSFTAPYFYLSVKIAMCWVMECTDPFPPPLAQTTMLCTFRCAQPIKIELSLLLLVTVALMGRNSFTAIIFNPSSRWR